MKIKILYFVDCLEPGGIQSLLLKIVKHLGNRMDISFLIFDSKEEQLLEETIKTYGCNIYRIPSLVTHPLKCFKECNKIFKNNNFDILHCHSSSKSVVPLKVAKKYGVKVRIEHVHSNHFQSKNVIKRLFGKMLIKPTCKYANYYMACSNSASKWMFKPKYIKNNKPLIIKNAIDTNHFAYNLDYRNEIRKMYKIDDDFVIGHVGRFIKVKNHLFLLDIFKEILSLHNNSKLLLVGIGPLMETVKRKALELGIEDKIIFANYQEDTSKYYSAFDAFVFPSLFEGLPFVGIEAQNSGLPCYFSSNISNEIAICKNQSYLLDLDEPSKNWAKLIVNNGINEDRKVSAAYMKNKGYDINDEINKLYDFYLKTLVH